jgi:hypothetical protein
MNHHDARPVAPFYQGLLSAAIPAVAFWALFCWVVYELLKGWTN